MIEIGPGSPWQIQTAITFSQMSDCGLSYPNFVRGLLLDDMQPLVSRLWINISKYYMCYCTLKKRLHVVTVYQFNMKKNIKVLSIFSAP